MGYSATPDGLRWSQLERVFITWTISKEPYGLPGDSMGRYGGLCINMCDVCAFAGVFVIPIGG